MADTTTATAPGLPPPPTPSAPALDAQVAPKTPVKDRIEGVLSSIVKASGGDSSPMDTNLKQHYDQRLAQAQLDQKHTTLYATILASAHKTVSPEAPFGMDPTTGQPMTKEQYDYYTNAYQSSMAAYEKSAGVNKQAKGMIGKAKMFMQHIVGSLPGQTAGAGAQKPGMPAPPATGGGASAANSPAAAAPTINDAQAGPSFPPPPPQMLQADLDEGTKIGNASRETTAAVNTRKQIAKEANITPGTEEWNDYVLGGKPPATHALTAKLYKDKDGNSFMGTTDPATGQIRNVDTGEVVPGALLSSITGNTPKPIHYKGPDGTPLFGYMLGTKLFDQEGKELPPDTQVFSAWMEPQQIVNHTWKVRTNTDGSQDLVPVTTAETRTRGTTTGATATAPAKSAPTSSAKPTGGQAASASPPAAHVAVPSSKPTKNADGSVPFGGKVPPQVQKAFDTYNGAQERYQVMQRALGPAMNGDQQAELNLLANHIGMTMGLQKGARITQAIYNEAMESAPWLARVASKFDKDGYLTGVTLTKDQMSQMMGLAKVRLDEDHQAWQREIDAAKGGYGMTSGNATTPPTKGGMPAPPATKPRNANDYLDSIGVPH